MRKAILSTLLLFAASPVWAQTDFREGVHYVTLDRMPAADPDGKVVVTEVFSYLCTHCNTFEPFVQNWLASMPGGVRFNRIHVEFGNPNWGLYARAYTAATVMGIEDESHGVLMDTIWKEQKPMRSLEELAEFYSRFGVERDKFLATARSFAVDMRMRRDQQLAREYGVHGTPGMVVNGKYRVIAVSGLESMLPVVDYLVARELAAQVPTQEAAEVAAAE